MKSLTSLSLLMICVKSIFCEFQTVLSNFSETDLLSCRVFSAIENGNFTIQLLGLEEVALITCNEEYDLYGPSIVRCVRGTWDMHTTPSCVKRCIPPPEIKFGRIEVENKLDDRGLYHKGTLATYSCNDGYRLEPPESRYRVCENGIWTGSRSKCVSLLRVVECPQPKEIHYGYYVLEKPREYEKYVVGQRIHYSCKPGYSLVGSSVQQCLEEGVWSPKIQPFCSYQTNAENSNCRLLNIPNSVSTLIEGFQSDEYATPGTVLEVRCAVNYRNARAPCQPAKLTCLGGRWIGVHPDCALAVGCYSPPLVEHATQVSLDPPIESDILPTLYPIKSQVSYQCAAGYVLEGNQILECTSSSCWYPSVPPRCILSTNYFLDVSSSVNAILISAATGAGVLGILMLICLVVLCRKRKPLTRAVPLPNPIQRPDLGDHAALLHHPALIALADGIQAGQTPLPSYEEATRERTPGLTVNRLHRPHWPNLVGGRRARNSPNADVVHAARHGSLASHTPSTRSVGDSMGSTDTVAISEVSTIVTLDTVSSYSGSQPASCRVQCGSLASFDTGSVVNTEGVPLLEESELEEMHGGDNISLVVENPSLISETASFKYSNNSSEIA